jgi:hypothetical protein
MFFSLHDVAIICSLLISGQIKSPTDRSLSGLFASWKFFCLGYGTYMAFTVPEGDQAAITPRITVVRAFTGNNPFPYMLHSLKDDY